MKAIIICGPTGAGKSSMALNLAKKFKGVIINADSVQIYREIKILSGRPTSDDYRQAPHRLYGIMSIFKPLGIWGKWHSKQLGNASYLDASYICGRNRFIKFLLNELSAIPEIPPSKIRGREKLEVG